MPVELSNDQKEALKEITDWFRSKQRQSFLTLGGYAGTGKTTLIGVLRRLFSQEKKIKVAFCAYTGKASRVLKSKLNYADAVFSNDFVGTIHSMIYSPVVNEKGDVVGWEVKKNLEYDLIIVDEASMIDNEIWNDLLSYGIPILAVGDHGQLPPIRGVFNLMEKPQIKLEEIHRQARDNPIIKLSIMARQGGVIPVGRYSDTVCKFNKSDADTQSEIGELLENYNQDTLVLCGYNRTRAKLNNFIRKSLEFEGDKPQANDRVICLKNNHKEGIFNGMTGTIKSISQALDEWYKVEILMDGEVEPYKGLISLSQFGQIDSGSDFQKKQAYDGGDQFDFGYALTVHKAQGSQAKRVILFEERFSQMSDDMWRRWLYTAVTRAESELYIIGR